MFTFLTLLLLSYKASVYDYHGWSVEMEACTILFYPVLQSIRQFFAGNAFGFDDAMRRNTMMVSVWVVLVFRCFST